MMLVVPCRVLALSQLLPILSLLIFASNSRAQHDGQTETHAVYDEQRLTRVAIEAPTETSDSKLLDNAFNFCNSTYLGDPLDESKGANISYQCRGPNYNDFGQGLHDFVAKVAQRKPPAWGHRRASVIPANKTLLFFGNSHTRQQGWALACQMGNSEVVDIRFFEQVAVRIRFRNKSSLYIVSNSYVAYSLQWQSLLERQIQKPLKEFDFVLLGMFNRLGNDSFYLDRMIEQTATLPDSYTMKFDLDPPGPGPLNVTRVYDGPFMLVSMFATTDSDLFDTYCQQVTALQDNTGRYDRSCLRARTFIEEMGEEGASINRNDPEDLFASPHRATALHRCMGPLGGYPDLIAWDLSEFLHQWLV